jgi:hypothetical protein
MTEPAANTPKAAAGFQYFSTHRPKPWRSSLETIVTSVGALCFIMTDGSGGK